MSKLEKVIAIIPALNEEKTIEGVLQRVKRYVDEIVLIDDGSRDKTSEIASKYAIVSKNPQNLGYDKSLANGFEIARKRGATIVVTLDADGQHLPEEIPLFTNQILNGEAEVVVGKRPYKARFMEEIFGNYAKRKIGIGDPLCGFKSYNIGVYDKIGFFDNIQSIGTQLLFTASKLGYKIKEIPISLNERKGTTRFGRQIRGNIKLFKAYKRLIKYLKSPLLNLENGN